MMTQIIIDGIVLPQTSRDRYSCHPVLLGEQIEMISGRIVQEIRGSVFEARYSYDYMGNELCRSILTVLRSGKSFRASVLPDDSDELISSEFVCTSLNNPVFAFSKSGTPYWHNFSFVIREVKPHD